VLDRNLPRLHGDEVCRALLAGGCQTRILMLTAHLPASSDRDISQERFDGNQEPAAS